MCIALLTTAHPDYALIVLDNRDEFILRPTSRPHWWSPTTGTAPPSPGVNGGSTSQGGGHGQTEAQAGAATQTTQILSARDLQRNEHGTWLGITRDGNFAVLTNFREQDCNDSKHPVHGQRSRGGMVTAWLAADPAETTEQFVERMLEGHGVKGVGGFSLICGKLRRRRSSEPNGDGAAAAEAEADADTADCIAPLAIISNRVDDLAHVPWIAGRRGEVYGLSNTSYEDPEIWPKVHDGKAALQAIVNAAVEARGQGKARDKESKASVDALRDDLFSVLDRNTLPSCAGLSFEEQIPLLKQSIFIPPIGDEAHQKSMEAAVAGGPREALATAEAIDGADAALALEERPDGQAMGFMTGLYGTQRQTVLLVDWDGHVSFTERALWDANGNPIPRGQGDVQFDFCIDGWKQDLA